MQTFILPRQLPRDRLLSAIAARLHELPMGVSWKLVISECGKERTSEQNAYLFGVCYPPIAAAKGYDVADIHEWMCGTHFGWVERKVPKTPRNPDGVESVPFRTTTRDENGKRAVLKKAQFSEFVETVMRIAALAGVLIPEPTQ